MCHFPPTFPVCSKFPDFSLTGKCLPIFPGFPVRVGTLHYPWCIRPHCTAPSPRHGTSDGYWSTTVGANGWYASCWNAFLFVYCFRFSCTFFAKFFHFGTVHKNKKTKDTCRNVYGLNLSIFYSTIYLYWLLLWVTSNCFAFWNKIII